jgi:hypothetical protein
MVRFFDFKFLFCLMIAFGTSLLPRLSYAGVFNLPHFVAPQKFAIGVEPELIMTDGASLGVNLRYTQGLSELNNFTGIIGSGGNNRQFRMGGAFTFDFFPDIENQPGIGLALQGLYVRLPNAGSVEVSGIPYIHKTFRNEQYHAEPYFAVPTGLALSQGVYQTIVSLVFGSLFHHSEHVSSGVEFGVSLNNAYTYISGGVIYYH